MKSFSHESHNTLPVSIQVVTFERQIEPRNVAFVEHGARDAVIGSAHHLLHHVKRNDVTEVLVGRLRRPAVERRQGSRVATWRHACRQAALHRAWVGATEAANRHAIQRAALRRLATLARLPVVARVPRAAAAAAAAALRRRRRLGGARERWRVAAPNVWALARTEAARRRAAKRRAMLVVHALARLIVTANATWQIATFNVARIVWTTNKILIFFFFFFFFIIIIISAFFVLFFFLKKIKNCFTIDRSWRNRRPLHRYWFACIGRRRCRRTGR